MRLRITLTTALAVLALLGAAPGAAAPPTIPAGPIAVAGKAITTEASPPPRAADKTELKKQNVILSVSGEPRLSAVGHTSWRYYETWQTDVCRTDSGQVVRVDGWSPKEVHSASGAWGAYLMNDVFDHSSDAKKQFRLKETKKIYGASLPPRGWQNPGFDDSRWVRYNFGGWLGWPVSENWVLNSRYRSLALMCLRGTFEVSDPARVPDLSLTLDFTGGAVVYLNGKEVGRSHLPAGELAPETLAEDYPPEIYVGPDGYPIDLDWVRDPQRFGKAPQAVRDDIERRLTKRIRSMRLSLPPSMLCEGANVLAVEIRRAPAPEAMFIKNQNQNQHNLVAVRDTCWWNRVSVEKLTLTTSANRDIVIPSISRPRKLCISNQPVLSLPHGFFCGDPIEALHPVWILGLRNGGWAGQLVASSPDPIKGIKANVTDLRGARGTIPASNIQIGYAKFEGASYMFDGLETSAPAEVPLIETQWRIKTAIQPIWFTVQVPRDAAAGYYSGTITIDAQGLDKPVEVPLNVKVAGEWVLPNPQQFVTYVSLMESPDTVAMQYKVPMWSDAHWKLLDKDFELLGQLGNKDLFIPLVSETYLGNERSMAYWIKQADGSYKIDFSIAEKYLDLAVKHWGKIPNVCVIANYGWASWNMTGMRDHPQTFTVKDAASGELKEVPHPAWGTPAALAFWKPVFEQFRRILAKRGLEQSLTIYQTQFCGGNPAGWKDLKTLIPDLKFTGRSHYDYGAPAGAKWFYLAIMIGSGVYWDPEEDAPYYGWREPLYVIASGRGDGQGKGMSVEGQYMTTGAGLSRYRGLPEMTLLSGVRSADHKVQRYFAKRGFGQWGGDFWPVLKDRDKKQADGKILVMRYSNEGSTSMEQTVSHLISPGREGPVPSCRSQMLREGLQEAEARVFVQNALLDKADKLGPELAQRCKEICDERTQILRYCSEFHCDSDLVPNTIKLYQVADEVVKAMGSEEKK